MTRTRSEPRAEIALLFAWNFAAVTAFFVGRAVRDALFLAHESADRLPYMYIASPLVVTLVGLAYGKVAPRFSRERLVIATPLVFAVLVVAARLLLGPSWLYYALYVVVECMGALAMMQFWLTAGERFSPRDAKRWFGVVAAGGTAANIAIGFLLRAVVGHTGVEDMLWLVAGALAMVATLAFFVGRRPVAGGASRKAAAPSRASGKASTKAEPVAGTSHLRLLAPMIACTMLAVTLLDFQFKAITTSHYEGDRVAMVEFFGTLSIVTGVASLLVQLTLTGRILGRFGIVGALLLLPSTMALGAAALLLVPSLVAATVSKFGDQTLRYTVHDAGMQLLYMPVPRAVRSKKKAFLDTVVRPASEATVGAVLLAYRALSGALWPLAVAALVVSLVWIALVVRLRKAYAGAIEETLRRRRVVALEVDERSSLEESASPSLRIATREAAAAVRRALASGEREVIVHGLELAAMSRLVEASALTSAELTPWTAHEDVEVRAAALRALYRTGDPADRARVVEQVGGMLASVDPSELRAGLLAVAELGDAAWTEAVLAHFDHRRMRRLVVAALGALGAGGAVEALVERISSGDEAVRDTACAALWAAARGGARLEPAERERVVQALKRELEIAFTAMAAAEGLGRRESTLVADGTRRLVPYLPDSADGPAALVSRALRERSEHATARALDLVGVLDPGLSLDVARANLREPEATRRANAVELLDAQRWAAPAAPFRALILAAIDESPRDRKLAIAERALELPRHTRDGWALVLLADADPWIVACAAYVAGATGIVATRERLAALASSNHARGASGSAAAGTTDALVVETARTALVRLDRKTEAGMLMTADKVLFLKGLELFAQVPGAALVEVVVATEEVDLEDGERLFAEGDPGDALYLIVEGRVAVMRGGAVLAELGAREVIGEMALLDSSPRSADAVARGPVRLLRLGRDDFANLLTERPEVATGVIRVLTRRLRAANSAR